jgi:hypothetical protein
MEVVRTEMDKIHQGMDGVENNAVLMSDRKFIQTILNALTGEYTTNEIGTLGCQVTPFGHLPGVLFTIFSILEWSHTPEEPGVWVHLYVSLHEWSTR